ncbi:RluA family pseudouridine synthase [Gammaproteobacteria bacterium]|jgi:23S rRNA pseudouridine955/2504/2580 synthase|nr:RluA family pseudouridine synthase [Gammaproteobacteria bacterium]
MMSVKKIVIDSDNSNRRLDNYLMSVLFDMPKSKIYSMIRKGEIRINSGRVKPSSKIQAGDNLRLPPYIVIPSKGEVYIPENLKVLLKKSVIYEDANFIAINKPIGLAVHGGTDNKFGVISIMRSIFGQSIDLCHRIDKETSGCLVLSKNKQSSKHFYEQLSARKVNKVYIAILKGILNKNIEIKSPVGDNHQSAQSKFKIIKKYKDSTYVEVQIFTGRTHQIRVHANEMGHPIINDKKYGDWDYNKKISKKVKRMGLHAHKLNFVDKDLNEINLTADIDETFEDLINVFN